MKQSESSIRFTEIQTKVSDPAIHPLKFETVCSYKTPSGSWITRITDTPKPSFYIIQLNPITDELEGSISYYRNKELGASG